ncbi:cyclohexyl-isocyanide hydratase [Acinetobacter calcoaceticus]|uniref:Cyclohexyl-isocyanide hydratase n=1 Tax=Acinetobacter calcoaceticus TaxID=471 RepID=A0A4R1Y2L6_ACICA|nr:cyclohexyl-isocyanide hydratase [Acinetobacter calcoaceticus]
MKSNTSICIGFLVYPNFTQLDLTGPFEVFSRIPDAKVHLIWKKTEPVRSDKGMSLLATVDYAHCPDLDLICIPGGPGQVELMQDHETLAFIRDKAQRANWVTSVCTGSLLLGAAGLLQGYRATCHWNSMDMLAILGAKPVAERVVMDRNRITGAGVTSGIDFGLYVVAMLFGEDLAQQIQLQMEYDPAPPFDAGSTKTASIHIMDEVQHQMSSLQQRRRAMTQLAATQLDEVDVEL